jgi:undecaprenyl-diphosphatase
MTLTEAILIAVVEGLTEYLPISSTGHMIITQELLSIPSTEFTKTFIVAIQFGAILAVVALYWKKFFDFKRWDFYLKLILAVIPALLFGALFAERIDQLLESSLTVAITMLAGGIVLLFIDRFFKNPVIEKDEEISTRKALSIGLWQCVAMIPGVSRSAASIIGGMQQKLTRKLAAEFSFFLAVPTMCAATGYKLLKGVGSFTSHEILLLSAGNIVAFLVAVIAIKFFIAFLQKNGFVLFGWYRIITGILLLILIAQGVIEA